LTRFQLFRNSIEAVFLPRERFNSLFTTLKMIKTSSIIQKQIAKASENMKIFETKAKFMRDEENSSVKERKREMQIRD
jgi:hypothetical protein